VIRALAIQNCELETLGFYCEALRARDDVILEVAHPYRGDALPAADEWDVALVGGTPISAYEADTHAFLRDELDLLRELIARQIPLFGVCCGAQMLAMLLGAEVRRASAMEVGGYRVRITDQGASDPLLANFPREFPVFHWHGDTFEIPRDGDLLIAGAECRNQMFHAGLVAGVQFHLETTAAEASTWAVAYADELAATGRSRAEVIDEAAASEVDRAQLARLLLGNFLKQHVTHPNAATAC